MSTPNIAIIQDFAGLFRGRSTAYGVHIPSGKKEANGKKTGKSFTKDAMVSLSVYGDHLTGQQGLGIVPINEEDKCWFGAIDVDEYNGERTQLVSAIYRSNLPIFPFRSKSGGLHLFMFFANPVGAAKVIGILGEFREILGLPLKTEIFPKQRSANGGVGNWINLPYFGDSDRCLLDREGKLIPLDVAVEMIKDKKVTEDSIVQTLASLPFHDGPPCLTTLTILGVPAFRNNFLFSAARYFKAKYGDDRFEYEIVTLNNELPEPIPLKELQQTIIATHRKTDYSYKCKDQPICDVCNKTKCRTRQFGIGGDEVSDLSFGQMTQVQGDPPYYEWVINNKTLKFYSEDDLMNQKVFLAQCIRELHKFPAQLKQGVWARVVDAALKNVVVRTMDLSNSMGKGALFMDYVVEYLSGKTVALASGKSQILINRPYIDPERHCYVFRGQFFVKWLRDTKQFREFSLNEIQDRLRELGAEPEMYYVDAKNRRTPVWTLPQDRIKELIRDTSEAMRSIDFKEELDGEEF